MSAAVLLASMLMALNPAPMGKAGSIQFAANDYYCSRTAGIALRVADGQADDDLADAARLVRDFAGQKLQSRMPNAAYDERAAGALGDRLTQDLMARYSRSGQREVLADALVGCAESL
jgi:hypothetical protein